MLQWLWLFVSLRASERMYLSTDVTLLDDVEHKGGFLSSLLPCTPPRWSGPYTVTESMARVNSRNPLYAQHRQAMFRQGPISFVVA